MRRLAFLSVVAAMLALAAACGGGNEGKPTGWTAYFPRGGTLRAGLVFADALAHPVPLPRRFDYFLDPQQAGDHAMWEVFRCCLLRTLLSYNGELTEKGGADLHPDLAAAMPDVSPDGLTWTFHLKRGIHYAPPFQKTEITAPDFVRAIERSLTPTPSPAAESTSRYLGVSSFYYLGVIVGAQEFADGRADTISGLEAPDDHTLVVHLSQPTGDLGYRFSLPASAPIPPSPRSPSARLGAAEGHDDGYGRFLVASGPYMLRGSDVLDFSLPPGEQKPVSGYVRGRRVTLVRNPSWDPASDRLRPAYVDRIELTFEKSLDEAAAKVDRGALDMIFDANPPIAQAARYGADPKLRDRTLTVPVDLVLQIPMNLALPPFDDVHVRRAVSWAIDKAGLVELANSRPFWFGPAYGQIAGHLAPDSVERNLLVDYDPYRTPGDGGDLARAKGEIALSPYDRDRDGICDHPACKNVLLLTYEDGALPQMAALVRADLQRIGIGVNVRVLPTLGDFLGSTRPSDRVPMTIGQFQLKDYPNGSTFFVPAFYGAAIEANPLVFFQDIPLVGATPEQLGRWGYGPRSVPSVDGRIDGCVPLVGPAQVQCWADLDQYLMEKVVPWVPYLLVRGVQIVGPRVVHFTMAQFTVIVALDHVALAPGST